jgi:hypothetical protein
VENTGNAENGKWKIWRKDWAGASQFLNSGENFSLAPGFSPVVPVRNRWEAVSTASVCKKTR